MTESLTTRKVFSSEGWPAPKEHRRSLVLAWVTPACLEFARTCHEARAGRRVHAGRALRVQTREANARTTRRVSAANTKRTLRASADEGDKDKDNARSEQWANADADCGGVLRYCGYAAFRGRTECACCCCCCCRGECVCARGECGCGTALRESGVGEYGCGECCPPKRGKEPETALAGLKNRDGN
ncbi:hypothetical protein K438DRAFT_1761624 [Mycena galopus ATCC 62051]|nr:hypothetical protein K438DRAFT_1785339 [Mycena galopus ATCC 62051]KAF8171568.1 hypothetical protein K438DRAFT_1773123 [Mycena galopus ATCC 62051]KAF8194073.1 hypothetical protein K438DRAFT_1761624 [Mycena galopus ATCC 62051]